MGKLRTMAAALLALTVFTSALSAQGGGTVAGRVTAAENGAGISGAQVRIQGSSRQTVTDADGNYRISSVQPGQVVISVSTLGRRASTQTVNVTTGATATANFSLAASVVAIEGVVVNAVTGQAERRREAGTNTGNIGVSEMNRGPITKFADVLAGRTTGVTLQGVAGTTGTAQRIRIRGANSLSLSNEPLVYIDGVQATTSMGGFGVGGQSPTRLNDLNPEDIENIEVLKGPAASALYGTAAANGVLLITTRRGRAGQTTWRVYGETGSIEDRNEYPLNWMPVTQATTTADSLYVSATGAVRLSPCSNEEAARALCTQNTVFSFDQFRDGRTTPFQTGHRGKLGFNVSGGAPNLTYYLSLDRDTEEGVIYYNTLDRTNLRANLNASLRPDLTVQVNAGYIRSDLTLISGDNNVFSPLINALLGPAQYIPDMESSTAGRVASCPTPTCAGRRRGSAFGYNNYDQQFVVSDQGVDRFVIGASSNFRPTSWLTVNGNTGLDYFTRFDQQSVDPNNLPLAASYISGFRQGQRSSNYQYTANLTGVGTFDLSNSLTTTTTVGTSYQQQRFQSVYCYGTGMLVGTDSCGGTVAEFSVDEGDTDSKLYGVFARQELAFRDRLFFAASLRGDRNSGLVDDFIVYPSANVSWVVTEEPFFPQDGLISNLRLRGAAGQSGLRPGFGDAETFARAVPVELTAANVIAAVPASTGNPNLVPERTTEYEVGADVGLFNDRISADLTYFTKRSEDALVLRNLAPSLGLAGGSVYQNLGSVRNWGTEIGLNALVLDRTNSRLNMRLSLSTLRSEVEELGEGIAPIVFNRGSQAHREGFPTGGYFQTPYTFADANNDGLISRSEVRVDSSKFLVVRDEINGGFDTLNVAFVGPMLPTNSQSLSGDLTLFRNITVSTLFERRAGHVQNNQTEYFRCRNPVYSYCEGRGNPDASLEEQARWVAGNFLGTQYGYLEKADFVKWREISLRLTAPESLGRRVSALRGGSLTLSGRNLKTWTDYSGLDPEANETGGSNFTQAEFNTQPPVRYFTVRLDFTF